MIDQQIKIKVCLVCFALVLLFGIVLIYSMFGCMDSQEQKTIDDVRIYAVFPDGTEVDVSDIFPPSKGWEAKEKEATL